MKLKMSTRSRIAYEEASGKIRSIYCHYDGYLRHNGQILFDHYNKDNIEELLDLGDLSMLRISPDLCEAYGRDRGESDTEALEFNSFKEYVDWIDSDCIDFSYILKQDGKWYYWTWDYSEDIKEVPEVN